MKEGSLELDKPEVPQEPQKEEFKIPDCLLPVKNTDKVNITANYIQKVYEQYDWKLRNTLKVPVRYQSDDLIFVEFYVDIYDHLVVNDEMLSVHTKNDISQATLVRVLRDNIVLQHWAFWESKVIRPHSANTNYIRFRMMTRELTWKDKLKIWWFKYGPKVELVNDYSTRQDMKYSIEKKEKVSL